MARNRSGHLRGARGRLDYVKEVADPAGITGNWQPIDGGFAYQTADGKVKLLLGARPAK